MTGQDIILKARRIADIVNSKFISNEEALDYLNEAYRVYYDKIIGTAVDWAMKSYAVKREEVQEFSDGNRIYWVIEPPKDMYKLRGLSVCVGGYRRDLRMFPKLEEFTFPECSYRLTSDHKIKVINPASADKGTFILEYYAPPQEISFEQPPLRSTEFQFQRDMKYCFDCGDYFVFGVCYDGSTGTKYYIWVVAKSDFSVVRKYEAPGDDCIIGVSKEWIYYFKEIGNGYDKYDTLIMRTSVSDPFAVEENVYTYEGRTESFVYHSFVNQSNDTVYLTVLSYKEERETVRVQYTIDLISVSNGKATTEHTFSDTVDPESGTFKMIFKTSQMYILIENIGMDHRGYACQSWESALNAEGVDITAAINDLPYFVDGKTLYCAPDLPDAEFTVIKIKDDFSTYTTEIPEKNTTPTGIEDDPYWEIYTTNADRNTNVYIKELAQPQPVYFPTGANPDYLAYYLAVCFLEKQGKDASRFQMKLSEIENRLIEELTADEHRHQSVANNFRKNNSGWGWL